MKYEKYQAAFGFDKWPVLPIHLVVETCGDIIQPYFPPPRWWWSWWWWSWWSWWVNSWWLTTSIAEVMSIAVSPPERCRGGSAVHALPTLCKKRLYFREFGILGFVSWEEWKWNIQSMKKSRFFFNLGLGARSFDLLIIDRLLPIRKMKAVIQRISEYLRAFVSLC